VGVFAVLPKATASLIPSFSATITWAVTSFDLRDIYIDVEVNGEGVLPSAIIA
jgi:hypothetical protein